MPSIRTPKKKVEVIYKHPLQVMVRTTNTPYKSWYVLQTPPTSHGTYYKHPLQVMVRLNLNITVQAYRVTYCYPSTYYRDTYCYPSTYYRVTYCNPRLHTTEKHTVILVRNACFKFTLYLILYMLADINHQNLQINAKRTELLDHPLVRSLVYNKWSSYGRQFYYSNLFIYTLFLIFLTINAVTQVSVCPPLLIFQQKM